MQVCEACNGCQRQQLERCHCWVVTEGEWGIGKLILQYCNLSLAEYCTKNYSQCGNSCGQERRWNQRTNCEAWEGDSCAETPNKNGFRVMWQWSPSSSAPNCSTWFWSACGLQAIVTPCPGLSSLIYYDICYNSLSLPIKLFIYL